MKEKIFIKTFGCHMNEYDSIRILDTVNKIGYQKTEKYGEDLIIYSGQQKVTIDLRPAKLQKSPGGGGYLSKINQSNIFSGFTISNGTIIENATGGSNSDSFYQIESVSNIINGNDGIDTVHYENNYDSYTISDLSGDGTHLKISFGQANDILYNIENIIFKNGTVNTSNIIDPSLQKDNYTDYLSSLDTPISINSQNNIVYDEIIISDNNKKISRIDVLLFNLRHTWLGDLKITLSNQNTVTSLILVNLAGEGKWGSNSNNFFNVSV